MVSGAPLDKWRVQPGRRFRIASRDPASTPAAPGDKDATTRESAALTEELAEQQERLWAEGERAVLLVLQAMDAGGKDGTIKRVFTGVNPHGISVTSFKVPTEEELDHDFLWRIHAATPRRGHIGIFNRSHYEDVLVVRVHGLITPQECRTRYEAINDFERLLDASGTRIVKVMLHVSKDEQAERLRKRLDDPAERWKFRAGDLDERKLWDDYMKAYSDAISATSTDVAPWYVVPANRKWYRDWAVLTILASVLREMAPRFPEPADDLDGLVIE